MHDQFHECLVRVGDALRLPPTQAGITLSELEQLRKSLDNSLSFLIPSPSRINDSRKEISAARDFAIKSFVK